MDRQARKISDIASGRVPRVTENEIQKALQLLADSPQGRVLESYLCARLADVSQVGCDEGAFREMEGERRFALKLLRLLRAADPDATRAEHDGNGQPS